MTRDRPGHAINLVMLPQMLPERLGQHGRQAPLRNQLKEESMSNSNQFIFGYGSLVESQSRARTSTSNLYSFPVNVEGIQRGWFDQVGGVSLATRYLGAVPDPNSRNSTLRHSFQ